ncbi:hypothetical protein [Micromonospora craniellae]|nr:hypothetical protein [Micromonospora craniellae]QOC94087.1 hypothetical protein ID554_11050 [Micromonospora craniellae]
MPARPGIPDGGFHRWFNPASTWPDGDYAKPGVVVTWRLDGGPVGS